MVTKSAVISDLKKMQQRIVDFRDARDWKQFHNPKDMALSLSLEAAELIEHFQWKNNDEIVSYVKNHKEGIGEELVDVFYWVLLIAHDLDMDLPKIFEKKMQDNEAKYTIERSKGNHKKYTELQE